MTTLDDFAALLAQLAASISGRPLGPALEEHLNAAHPAGSDSFDAIREACEAGIAAGWLCARGAGGIRYGRVIKPGPATCGFSVDVVLMDDLAGPHHAHPNGEIDMIMPIDAGACFDGRPAGWLVYDPGTAHAPTVTGGKAIVLYLLPDGAIDFTRA